MKTKAGHFASALSRLMPILKRTTMPILTCAKLEAKDGRLTAYATDIDAFGAASCECEGELQPVCVDATSLLLLVKQANEQVEIELSDKRLLVAGNGLATLGTQPANEFPEWPKHTQDQHLGVTPADLATCIKAVAWAAHPHPKVTIDLWRECVWVKISSAQVEVCATDGKEFAHTKLPLTGATECQFMFPATQAALLTDALLTGADSVHLTDNWITTESTTFKVAIKQAEGKFIPVQYILDQKRVPIGVFQICQLVDTLHTIKALGKNEPWTETKIRMIKDKIHISYRGPNNQFERELAHENGEATTIKLDTERAIEVMSHIMPGAKANLGDGMLIFYDDANTYAIALMRGD